MTTRHSSPSSPVSCHPECCRFDVLLTVHGDTLDHGTRDEIATSKHALRLAAIDADIAHEVHMRDGHPFQHEGDRRMWAANFRANELAHLAAEETLPDFPAYRPAAVLLPAAGR